MSFILMDLAEMIGGRRSRLWHGFGCEQAGTASLTLSPMKMELLLVVELSLEGFSWHLEHHPL